MGVWSEFSALWPQLCCYAPIPDEAYLCFVAEKARELGVGINTHLSESLSEIEDIKKKYGCSPVELYDRCGLLGRNTVAAHCVHLSPEDMDLLARRGVSVAVNHASNLKLANGIAPVTELQKRGINLCLGTDRPPATTVSACFGNWLL